MVDIKRPHKKKSQLVWEHDSEGFVTPSGSVRVDPFAPPSKKFDLLNTRPGTPCNVVGRWPGGKPR